MTYLDTIETPSKRRIHSVLSVTGRGLLRTFSSNSLSSTYTLEKDDDDDDDLCSVSTFVSTATANDDSLGSPLQDSLRFSSTTSTKTSKRPTFRLPRMSNFRRHKRSDADSCSEASSDDGGMESNFVPLLGDDSDLSQDEQEEKLQEQDPVLLDTATRVVVGDGPDKQTAGTFENPSSSSRRRRRSSDRSQRRRSSDRSQRRGYERRRSEREHRRHEDNHHRRRSKQGLKTSECHHDDETPPVCLQLEIPVGNAQNEEQPTMQVYSTTGSSTLSAFTNNKEEKEASTGRSSETRHRRRSTGMESSSADGSRPSKKGSRNDTNSSRRRRHSVDTAGAAGLTASSSPSSSSRHPRCRRSGERRRSSRQHVTTRDERERNSSSHRHYATSSSSTRRRRSVSEESIVQTHPKNHDWQQNDHANPTTKTALPEADDRIVAPDEQSRRRSPVQTSRRRRRRRRSQEDDDIVSENTDTDCDSSTVGLKVPGTITLTSPMLVADLDCEMDDFGILPEPVVGC